MRRGTHEKVGNLLNEHTVVRVLDRDHDLIFQVGRRPIVVSQSQKIIGVGLQNDGQGTQQLNGRRAVVALDVGDVALVDIHSPISQRFGQVDLRHADQLAQAAYAVSHTDAVGCHFIHDYRL